MSPAILCTKTAGKVESSVTPFTKATTNGDTRTKKGYDVEESKQLSCTSPLKDFDSPDEYQLRTKLPCIAELTKFDDSPPRCKLFDESLSDIEMNDNQMRGEEIGCGISPPNGDDLRPAMFSQAVTTSFL